MREEIRLGKEELEKARRCSVALKLFSEINQDLLENVPQQALRKSVQSPSSTAPTDSAEKENVPTGKTTKSCPRVNVSTVSYLTVDEFEKVPKYMKGRLSYETLSQAVDEFNKCVTTKYEFLARPLKELGLNEKKRRNVLKSQDKSELKQRHFVTVDELKDYSMFKTENVRKSVVTVLRHFQKIRENRGPGSIVRFVVV